MQSISKPDSEIIERCMSAKNADKFNRLYEGDWESMGYKSQSEADLALCNILNFYTHDPAQINRLFMNSCLYRGKWDRANYMGPTISKALKSFSNDPLKQYFTEKGAFISKSLAEDIMAENQFITLEDTREILVYREGKYETGGENLIMKVSQAKLQERSKKSYITEVTFYIQNATMTCRESLNNDHQIINLKNGLYDLKHDKFMPHDPTVLSTVQIPVNYNPDAKCPAIDKFVSEVVSEEDKQVLLEVIGYSMIPDYSIQKAFMLLGSGSNGKSVFLNMLRMFIGNENCSGESLQLLEKDKYSTANLYGKLLNVCPDIPNSKIYDNSIFKMLTGNEQRIRAEKKYQGAFEFNNTARLIFSANDLPPVANGNHAYFRRWQLIDFPNQFKGEKADRNLIDKLTTEEELSGLLNEALIALKWLLEKGEFSYNKTEAEVERLYRIKSDNVAAFADECVKMSLDETLKAVMYDAYTKWCKKQGLKIVSNGLFGKKFKNLGYESSREGTGKRDYVWEGVTVELT
jgi:putative DNA primase/helicase